VKHDERQAVARYTTDRQPLWCRSLARRDQDGDAVSPTPTLWRPLPLNRNRASAPGTRSEIGAVSVTTVPRCPRVRRPRRERRCGQHGERQSVARDNRPTVTTMLPLVAPGGDRHGESRVTPCCRRGHRALNATVLASCVTHRNLCRLSRRPRSLARNPPRCAKVRLGVESTVRTSRCSTLDSQPSR